MITDNEPTVVFTRIRIPSNNLQHNFISEGQDNNYLIKPQQPTVDSLIPTTYRPSSHEVLFQNVANPTAVSEPSPLPEATPRPLITLYDTGNPHQHQYFTRGQPQINQPANTGGFSPISGYLIQNVPASVHYSPSSPVIQPLSSYNYPGATKFVGVLSNAATLLRSTADKMTRLGIPSPFPFALPDTTFVKPVRIPGYTVNPASSTAPLGQQQVVDNSAGPVSNANVSPYKIHLTKAVLGGNLQYGPKKLRYSNGKYAGSMPPPGPQPAPLFHNPTQHAPQIYLENASTREQIQNSASSASIQKSIYSQPPNGHPTPNHYYIRGQQVQPILTLLRSYTDSLVHAFNKMY